MNFQIKTKASDYFSLITFSHTVFALPFALIGFFLGVKQNGQSFSSEKLFLVILCMVFARSAAMAFNRYIDRDIDGLNERTAGREIPSGIIHPISALVFAAISSVLFISSTYFINPVCFYLSPVALIVVLGYSFTKRFTFLCHFILGIGLSLAPLGAFLAVTGTFDLIPVMFSFVVLFWVSGFDIIYALQDEGFDREHQLKSLPSRFGKKNAIKISFVLHFLCGIMLASTGLTGNFGIWYWAGVVVFCSFLVFQHTLVKPEDLSRVNLAFFTFNGIASILFAGFVLLDLLI